MKWLLRIFLLINCLWASGQQCLNNFTFSTNALFDPSWIYSCATGTSCSGGTQFYNQPACEPTAAMDACATAPTGCGTEVNEYDLWYSFYPTSTTVTLSVIQNTSFVTAIQAFSGSTTCPSLTQIGCAVSIGPSGGVILDLTGLTLFEKYYFRVYGSANNVSQRTGVFCFCGTTGISNSSLAVSLSDFSATADHDLVTIKWTTLPGNNDNYFQIEKSLNGVDFEPITTVDAGDQWYLGQSYEHTYRESAVGEIKYRLRVFENDGSSDISGTAVLYIQNTADFQIIENPVQDVLSVFSEEFFTSEILSMDGNVIARIEIIQGENSIDVQQLQAGMYLFKNVSDETVKKFMVVR